MAGNKEANKNRRFGIDIEQYEVLDIYHGNVHKGIYYCLDVSNGESIDLLNLRTKITEKFLKSEITGSFLVNLCDIELDNIELIKAFFFKKPNFTNAKLKDINFSEAHLFEADFTNAVLENVNFTNAEFSRANLTNSKFIGNIIFTNAKFSRANFYGTKFEGIIDFSGAKLSKSIDFVEAKFKGKINFSKAVFSDITSLNRLNLPNCNLTGAIFHSSLLQYAIFTESNLSEANFDNCDLSNANLLYCTLTNTSFQGAIFTDTKIFRGSLSEKQIQQIRGFPMYMDEEIQNKIIIPKNISNGNNGGVDFTRLFEFLLNKKNQLKIANNIANNQSRNVKSFHILGEQGSNQGGITRTVFDKCYKVFMERYFQNYKYDDKDYVILKKLNLESFGEFMKACEFMILLAKKGNVQIFIPLNKNLFDLLFVPPNKDTPNKDKDFYLFNENTFFKKNDPRNNNRQRNVRSYVFHPNISGQFNNANNKKQVMFEMFLQDNSFDSIEHYQIMKRFIQKIWENNPFVYDIDYSYDEFVKRLRICLPKKNPKNENVFISFKEFMNPKYKRINTYPLIKLILDYLKISDNYRIRFTIFTCGSYNYSGDIYIIISNTEIHKSKNTPPPFYSSTCAQTLQVFIDLRKGCQCPDAFDVLKIGNGRGNAGNEHENGNGNARNENENGNARNENENENGNARNENAGNENENENGNGRGNKSCNYSIKLLHDLFGQTTFTSR